MKVKLELDWSDDEQLSQAQAVAQRLNLEFEVLTMNGPAGGNPLLLWTGEDRKILDLVREYCNGDEDDIDLHTQRMLASCEYCGAWFEWVIRADSDQIASTDGQLTVCPECAQLDRALQSRKANGALGRPYGNGFILELLNRQISYAMELFQWPDDVATALVEASNAIQEATIHNFPIILMDDDVAKLVASGFLKPATDFDPEVAAAEAKAWDPRP